MNIRIVVSDEKIADFCRRHRVRKLVLFGSVLRDDFGPQSDVDVLAGHFLDEMLVAAEVLYVQA